MDTDTGVIVLAIQQIMEVIDVSKIEIETKPRVVSEDSPDMRKARLIKALKQQRPIQKDKWGLFMDCLEKHLNYNPKIVQEHPIDYLLDSLQADQVNEGLVCHLLEMVKE